MNFTQFFFFGWGFWNFQCFHFRELRLVHIVNVNDEAEKWCGMGVELWIQTSPIIVAAWRV